MGLEKFIPRKPLRGRFRTMMRQRFFYCPGRNEAWIRIREPYYSAGKRYQWPGSPISFGLNIDILNFAVERNAWVCVFTPKTRKGDQPKPEPFSKENPPDRYYKTKAKDWKAFAEQWKSIEKRGIAVLYIFQWNRTNFHTVKSLTEEEINLCLEL